MAPRIWSISLRCFRLLKVSVLTGRPVTLINSSVTRGVDSIIAASLASSASN